MVNINFGNAGSLSICIAAVLCSAVYCRGQSLPPLKDGRSPETLAEVWGDYDPRAEPLEVKVYKEWEEDGITCQILRYKVGDFKGKPAWMAATYTFPTSGKNLPALVQLHGGGQCASMGKCKQSSIRGYTCISINWGANKFHDFVDLPAEAQTDWGAVAGAQTSESRGIEPTNDQKLDPVASARNDGYFLRTLAARRALTFLEQQPNIDPEKLGAYGFSMGGVITLRLAAIDKRVKAAAPSGAPPLTLEDTLKARTSSPIAYAPEITCPILFPTALNDFHGHVDDIEWVIDHMPSKTFAMCREPHFNHKGTSTYGAATPLWFDAHLKKSFAYPDNPEIELDFKSDKAQPKLTIKVDKRLPVKFVDVYYSRDGLMNGFREVINRFWEFSKAEQNGATYQANLKLYGTERPLWVYVNVHYDLPPELADKARSVRDRLVVSSRLLMLEAKDLPVLGQQDILPKTNVIQSFEDSQWKKRWFSTRAFWPMNSFCSASPALEIPNEDTKLVFELRADEPNTFVLGLGNYYAEVKIFGGPDVQRIELSPSDFLHNYQRGSGPVAIADWSEIWQGKLYLGPSFVFKKPKDAEGKKVALGGAWNGKLPEFKKLYWSK